MSDQPSRILIVDDEKVTTRLLRMTLEQTKKYEVREVNDSKLVVQAALAFHPDLIVLDVIMPDMDGGDVAAALKDHPSLSRVPVVFLTATVRKSEVDARGGVMGGYPFLAKPASTDAIVQFIEKNLGH
ncbi:MAG: response regulator [Chthoniobacteraceae bacterium]